jgi:hypothetical protein
MGRRIALSTSTLTPGLTQDRVACRLLAVPPDLPGCQLLETKIEAGHRTALREVRTYVAVFELRALELVAEQNVVLLLLAH